MIFGTQEFVDLLHDVTRNEKRHEVYAETERHAKEMSIHVFGDKPMHLLERARPREDTEVKSYRIENYEPTTKAGCDKAIDIVSKIFNPQLYSIRWKKDSEQIKELKSYTFEYYPDYNSLMSFNKDVVLRKMIADPNGILAVKPNNVPENDAERVEPIVVVYGSSNVWFRDSDHVLIFIRKEVIEKPGKEERFYFDYYDRSKYLNFYAYYDAASKMMVVVEVQRYDHNFDEMPVWSLRGKSRDLNNGTIIFESYFSPALPHWNLAVIHESDLLGAYINHMHPQKYELAEDCAYQFDWQGMSYPCRGGTIKYPGGKKGEITDLKCPHCLGTGLTAVKSPYGAYQFTKDKLDVGDSFGRGGLLPVGYVTIPVDATKMLDERAERCIQKGMWAINMDIEEKVGEDQSGVAKVIDRSAQHDTLMNISTTFYDIHVNNEFYFINKYMFGVEASSARNEENDNLPEINKPTQFDITSVSELVNNFSVAKQSGLDRNFLQVRQIEIISRDLSTNPDLKRYMVGMLQLDPLPGMSIDDVKAIAGTEATMVDAVIHINLKKFMDRAITEDPKFLDKTKEEQYQKLQEFAQEVISANKPALDESVLDDTGATSDQD